MSSEPKISVGFVVNLTFLFNRIIYLNTGDPMPNFIPVAKVTDLKPGQAKMIMAGGHQIALFNVGGSFYATSNICLHMGGPLGDGDLSDQLVTCPWHGWEYDVKTGECLTSPALKVQTYEVKVERDEIQVGI